MTAEQLKASLLQMAIQGKLVPQLDDEPPVEIDAEELEDLPFSIPNKWKWVKLRSILSGIEAGKSYKCIEKTPVAAQCGIVKVSAVTWGTFLQDESKTCYDNNCWKQEYAIHTHDFLISRANTADLVGSCVIVEHISKKLMLSDKILRLRFSSFIYPYFLLWVMRTKMIRYQLLQLATGTSNSMKNISQEAIKSLQLPLPPLAEQRRIVDRLNELLPIVEEYGKSQKALQALETELPDKLRSSLLQQAIIGKLVPQLDDEPAVDIDSEELDDVPFAIPEKWKWVKLHDIGTIVSGATPKTNVKEYWSPAIVPWITPADLGKNKKKTISCGERFISKKGYQSCSAVLLPKGSVVYSSRAPIGHIAITKNELATNQGCKSISPNFQIVLSEYIYYALIALTKDIQSRASGTTFLEISGKKMGDTLFPLPPLDEQRRIVTRLNELLPYINSMRNSKWKN